MRTSVRWGDALGAHLRRLRGVCGRCAVSFADLGGSAIGAQEEAKKLVHAAIMSGINNDLGSGGSVDLMVITKEGNTPLRNYDRPNQRKSKRDYTFPVGTTTVLSEKFTPLSSLVTIEKTVEPTGAQMEIG